jgi:hypothetical protein
VSGAIYAAQKIILTSLTAGNVSGICPECGTPLTEAQRAALAAGGPPG